MSLQRDELGALVHSEDDLVLLPGPRCRRCGHRPCPMCQNWCDVIVRDDEGEGMCCDGRCDFPPGSVDNWVASFPEGWGEGGRGVRVAHGPEIPPEMYLT